MLAVQANKTRNLRTTGGDVEKMITEGTTFEGQDAVDYARELKLVQGSANAPIPTSLVQSDPETAAAYGNRKADAGYNAMIKCKARPARIYSQRSKSSARNTS